MKKKIVRIFIIFFMIIFLILVFKRSSKNINSNVTSKKVSPFLTDEIEVISEKIPEALSKVEMDYQQAKKSYSGYQRRDFYNSQRMSENMDLASLEFVNLENIDLEKVYDLQGNKVKSLDLSHLKKINKNLSNLDTNQNFEDGKYYLLRAESYSEDINLYYIVQFDNNGVSNVELIFYTENEIVDYEMNEFVSEDEN